eukprot:910431-Prymnesium_polylepis.1
MAAPPRARCLQPPSPKGPYPVQAAAARARPGASPCSPCVVNDQYGSKSRGYVVGRGHEFGREA